MSAERQLMLSVMMTHSEINKGLKKMFVLLESNNKDYKRKYFLETEIAIQILEELKTTMVLLEFLVKRYCQFYEFIRKEYSEESNKISEIINNLDNTLIEYPKKNKNEIIKMYYDLQKIASTMKPIEKSINEFKIDITIYDKSIDELRNRKNYLSNITVFEIIQTLSNIKKESNKFKNYFIDLVKLLPIS